MSSGFKIENRGLLKSLEKPLFSFVSSFVITHEFDISLPAAEIVKIDPTGILSFTFSSPMENFHGLKSTLAPAEIAFDESNTDPPPTARIKSTFSLLTISTPFSTKLSLGFGSTPPNSTNSMLASFSFSTITSYRPDFLIDDFP